MKLGYVITWTLTADKGRQPLGDKQQIGTIEIGGANGVTWDEAISAAKQVVISEEAGRSNSKKDIGATIKFIHTQELK